MKIHLKINFSLMPSKDSNDERLDDSESNNKDTMIGVAIEKIIRKLSNSLSCRCQVGLEQPMKNSDFSFFLCFIMLTDCSISVIR